MTASEGRLHPRSILPVMYMKSAAFWKQHGEDMPLEEGYKLMIFLKISV